METSILTLEKEIDGKKGVVISAIVDGLFFAGYASLSSLDKDFIWIDQLFVSDKFREKQVGSAIICAAKSIAREMGKEGLSLGVKRSNKGAIRLYTKFGFIKVHEYDDDDYLMYTWIDRGG